METKFEIYGMGPADDIIDVLYRYQYETSNNVENEGVDLQWEAEQYNNPHVQELVKQQQRGGQNYRNHNNNNRQAIRHQQQGQQYYKQQRYQTNELYYNTREILEEEPIYVPRSIKADIIFKNDDDFFRRRRDPNETLVELASGAFQKKVTMPSVEHNGNGLRKRLIRQQGNECTGDTIVKPNEDTDKSKIAHDRANVSRHLLNVGNTCLGLVIMAVMAYKFSGFLAQLHENDMWFSEITEVEREISFRTEQGLYYSYFKQLIKADSFLVGVSQLASDNKTESTNTINIMQRFNIHQEIVLSVLYRIIQPDMAPILFYVSGVFSLQVVLYSALFVISWSLTGTWFSGVLALVYASMNRKVSFFKGILSFIILRLSIYFFAVIFAIFLSTVKITPLPLS